MTSARITLVLLALLAACGEDAATSIRLAVAPPPGASLESLAIVVGGERSEVAMAHDLTVLVPDAWAASPVHIEVEGLRAAAVVATGAVEVVPRLGEEVLTVVQLVNLGCADVCAPGAVRCDGDGTIECTVDSATGCPAWSASEPCPDAAPFCSNGTCSATCTDECTAGAMACDGALSVHTCANVDSDPCLDWSSAACESGELCVDAACATAYPLTIVVSGSGSGTVVSIPGGIHCGADCAESYPAGVDITLTATPAGDSTFTGWSGGGCSGTAPCTVSLAAATTVTATFAGACPSTCSALPVHTPAVPIGSMAADATHMYWASAGGIMRRNLATGSVETFAAASPRLERVRVDATHVYWMSASSLRTIQRQAKSGGAIENVVSNVAGDVVDFAIDGTHVYWTEASTWLVRKRPKSGGTIVNLDDDLFQAPQYIEVDDTHVYWSDVNDAVENLGTYLNRIPKNGGSTMVVKRFDRIDDIEIDGSHVYVVETNLVRIAKAGGATATLVNGLSGYHMALGATHIAFVDLDVVYLIPKAGGAARAIGDADQTSQLLLTSELLLWETKESALSLLSAPLCACTP